MCLCYGDGFQTTMPSRDSLSLFHTEAYFIIRPINCLFNQVHTTSDSRLCVPRALCELLMPFAEAVSMRFGVFSALFVGEGLYAFEMAPR